MIDVKQILTFFGLVILTPVSSGQTVEIKNLELLDNSISDILQDSEGFLWLSTWTGLLKYDGFELRNYRQQDKTGDGMSFNNINCLFEDSQHRIWIGTSHGGLYQYVRETDGFIRFVHDSKNENSLNNDVVNAIIEDTSGHIWIGTAAGLSRLDTESHTFKHYLPSPDSHSITHKFISSLTLDSYGCIWVGTQIGLNRFNPYDNEIKFHQYELYEVQNDVNNYYKHNFVHAIHASLLSDSKVWVGTGIGIKLLQFDPEDPLNYSIESCSKLAFENKERLSVGLVSDILEEDNSLWLNTNIGLICIDEPYHNNSWVATHHIGQNSLSKCIYKDNTGMLWVGTQKGLYYLESSAADGISTIHLPSNHILKNSIITQLVRSKLYPDVLWATTLGKGLVRIQLDLKNPESCKLIKYTLKPELYPDLSEVLSDIFIEDQGRMWIATQGAGLLQMYEHEISADSIVSRNIQQYTKKDGLTDDYLMSIARDANNNFVLGYWDDGLQMYFPTENKFQQIQIEDPANTVIDIPIFNLMTVQNNGEDAIWLGTRGRGAIKITGHPPYKILETFAPDSLDRFSLSHDVTNGFYLQDSTKLWVNTDRGLNVIQLETNENARLEFTRWDNPYFPPRVLLIKNGYVWHGNEQNISKISISKVKFNSHATLNTDSLSYIPWRALEIDENNFVFPSNDGFISWFNPSEIQLDTTAPNAVIKRISVFNKQINVGQELNGRVLLEKAPNMIEGLDLKPNENSLSFEFVGIHLGHREFINYEYKLAGFDKDWIETSVDRPVAHYTSLPYGKYTFQLRASNADEIWSSIKELPIKIRRPFYLSIPAYFGYLFLLFTLLWFVRRITQLRSNFRHNLQLERIEREKLEEVNAHKLDFFTNISHELRTPLTLILSPLEQWIKSKSFEQERHDELLGMYDQANRLLSIINQLLDFRKTEDGLLKLKVTIGDISTFIKEIMLSFQGVANKRNIQLDLIKEKNIKRIWFDRLQMEKVVFNLLSNAFKYTEDNGKIIVYVTNSIDLTDQVRIAFTDDGKGILAKDIPYVFDKFYQANGKEQPKKNSSGLGLALVKNIVEAHKGDITVESELNHGTSFIVHLKTSDHFSEEQKITNYNGTEKASSYSAVNEIKSNEGQSNGESDNVLLIVEDNDDIRTYLVDSLKNQYRVIQARNGQEGVEKAKLESPDLILADITMPVMDGIQMCKQIKSDMATSHIPVILLTARTSMVYRIEGLETGADDYVTKPFHLDLLRLRLRNLMWYRENLRKHFNGTLEYDRNSVVLHALDDEFISRMHAIIDDKLGDENFTVDVLAQELHLSKMQLHRKLKSLTGNTPGKAIRKYRLQKAAELLKTQNYNVMEVTYMVGYSDLKYFREQFKKEFNVQPSLYQAKARRVN